VKTEATTGVSAGASGPATDVWVDQELSESSLCDERLNKRLRSLVKQLADGDAESIPMACQDWANTKAAYRFLSNERVDEQDILSGHFQATRSRFDKASEKILVLHDTTQLSYRRKNIGILYKPKYGGDSRWRNEHPLCGISMHSSLVVTTDGLPLGLAAIKFWTRKKFKGANALKHKINPTRVPIEKKESLCWVKNLHASTRVLGDAGRCVHVGDRASDVYELFCAAQDEGAHFVVRTCVDRRTEEGVTTIEHEMAEVPAKGDHRVEIRDKRGQVSVVTLKVKYQRLKVLPPKGKQSGFPALTLTAIHAREKGRPKGRGRIDWKLITDLPILTLVDAIEKINWYALRWKIEVFHKILKSGLKVEAARLRTAPRLVNLISVCCILSWRIFWMTMANRTLPSAAPAIALTPIELKLLDHLVVGSNKNTSSLKNLAHYMIKIARLGGYLARAGDPPPGNIVMWRGLSRLIDITLGFSTHAKIVGN
jgi:Transposase DNA-binding/Transposase DDE domain